jgi:hypothetical protein
MKWPSNSSGTNLHKERNKNERADFLLRMSQYLPNQLVFSMNQPMIKDLYHVDMDGILVDVMQESLHFLSEGRDLQLKVHCV